MGGGRIFFKGIFIGKFCALTAISSAKKQKIIYCHFEGPKFYSQRILDKKNQQKWGKWLETVFKRSSEQFVALETVLRWLKTVLKWLEEVLNIDI